METYFAKIGTIDMDGYWGREHHPTKEMEGQFVRITNMDTIPPDNDVQNERPDHDTRDRDGFVDEGYHVFTGILVDANGNDVEGGEVELIDHELHTTDGVVLFTSALL